MAREDEKEINLNDWSNADIEAAPLAKKHNVSIYGQHVGALAECVGTGFCRLTPNGTAWGDIPKGLSRRAWSNESAAIDALQKEGCAVSAVSA